MCGRAGLNSSPARSGKEDRPDGWDPLGGEHGREGKGRARAGREREVGRLCWAKQGGRKRKEGKEGNWAGRKDRGRAKEEKESFLNKAKANKFNLDSNLN